jgi:predicted outer membrane repeat protein
VRYPTAVILAALIVCGPAEAATHVVQSDGTGDFPTIQLAIAAAVDGDVIALGDGTFTGDGNRNIDFLGRAITVRSLNGSAEGCIIDCEGSEAFPQRGFHFHSGEGSESYLEGITIAHGWTNGQGGAILCDESASPTILSCRFVENVAGSGGGMYGGESSTVASCLFAGNSATRGGGMADARATAIIDCAFVGNSATYGGAIYIRSDCSPSIDSCVFTGNTASHSGGALHIELHCYPVVTHSIFSENSSNWGGAVIIEIECAPTFMNCTFWQNSSTYTAAISCYEISAVVLENSIIAYSQVGEAVGCWDSEAILACCDVFGNSGGDWIGCLEGQLGVKGNFAQDPMFCEPQAGDFTIHEMSPCAPDQNDCGVLIGARGIGCAAVAREEASWGVIKALYR